MTTEAGFRSPAVVIRRSRRSGARGARCGAADLVPLSIPGTEALLHAVEAAGVEVRRSAFLG